MKKMLVVLSVLALQAIVSAGPSWLGSAGTVHAEWTSWKEYKAGADMDQTFVTTDTWHASDPSRLAHPDAPDAWIDKASVGFCAVVDGRQDVLTLTERGSFGMNFFMPNYNDSGADTMKEIWITITYKPCGDSQFIFNVDPVYSDQTLSADIYGAYLEERVQLGDGWLKDAYSFVLFPNCDWEFIDLGFNASAAGMVAVDSVTIDTLCIPEPATLGLLVLGSTTLLRRRRRTA